MPSLRFLSRLALFGIAGLTAGYLIANMTQTSRQERAIVAQADTIYRSPTSYVAGNPDGDVSVVAFFDYNCPYCRDGASELAKLIGADKGVRLVLKELPVLGKDSEQVARVAQAAIAQGKYHELYERLIAEPGRATRDKALRIADELGLDRAKLEQDMGGPAVENAIAENEKLATAIRVRGVPFYLVGDRPVPSNADADRFAAEIAAIREEGCRAKC